ncbi:MAG TPA: M24 family metallopeptidase [Solirubrobacteraceae bacterium]|nr:M24 family metallopeptidase [Solirubrobacteraceae bacterium]
MSTTPDTAPRCALGPADINEYRRRFEAAREIMERNGLDAIVVGSGPPQVTSSSITVGSHGRFAAPRYHRYFSGFHIWGAESFGPQPVVVLLPLQGEPALITRAGTLRTWTRLGRAHTWIDDVVGTYHDDPEWEQATQWGLASSELPTDVAAVLADRGLEGSRVGLTGSWPGMEQTWAALPNVTVRPTLTMDGAGNPCDVLEPLLARNSPWEVDRLARAQAGADDAMRAFMDAAADGAPIDHAVAEARHRAIRAGCEDTILELTSGLDEWALWVYPAQPREAEFRTGDLVTIGLMNSYDGYWIQMPRTWIVGGAQGAQQPVFDAARRSLDAMLALVGPGVTGGELWDAGLAPIAAAGMQPRGRLGHSVGFTGVTGPERFSILPGNDVPMEEGLAFVLHPCVFDRASGAVVQFGDTLVIDNGTARFLSPEPVEYEP